jgi:5-methylcytosine-specific restriction endonuclease McrA
MKICVICFRKAHHKHHIVSKSKGGSNKPYNLCNLCASCHVEVHQGNIIIEGNFQTTNGYTTLWHTKGEKSITNSSPDVYLINS